MGTVKAEISDLVSELRAAGWRVRECGSHRMVYPPQGKFTPVTIPGTPRGQRWRRNLSADLRKRGFEWRAPLPQKKVRDTSLSPHAVVEQIAAARIQETPQMAVQPVSTPEKPAMVDPDGIVDIRPAPIGIGTRTTQTVMEIRYADGRTRYRCSDHVDIEGESVYKILRHRRDVHPQPQKHLAAVPSPTVPQQSAPVEQSQEATPQRRRSADWLVSKTEAWLREQVTSGAWAPGESVPSSYILAARFGCSRPTVDNAFTRLTAEGLFIMPNRRVGRLVANPLPEGVTTAQPAQDAEPETAAAPTPETAAVEETTTEVVEAAAVVEPFTVAPEADIITRAREAFGTLSALMSGLIDEAERARGEAAEAAAKIAAAEAVAAKAKRRADEYEEEVVAARRRAHEAEAKLTQVRAALGSLAA